MTATTGAMSVTSVAILPLATASPNFPDFDIAQAEGRRKVERVASLGGYGLLNKPLSEPAPHFQLRWLIASLGSLRSSGANWLA